jgi:hypothetical protein
LVDAAAVRADGVSGVVVAHDVKDVWPRSGAERESGCEGE